MTAQQLLDRLRVIEDQGLDLSKIEVELGYTVYDPNIPYDIGCPQTKYFDNADLVEDRHGVVSLLLK